MTVVAFVLGLLFLLNTTAFTLVAAACLCKSNPYKLMAVAGVVVVVNIVVNSLLIIVLR